MSTMELYESAYWLSWHTWEAFLTLLSSIFTVLFGMMFQFDFFLNNSFRILFLLCFLFQPNMVSSKLYILCLICLFLFEVLNSDKYHASINEFDYSLVISNKVCKRCSFLLLFLIGMFIIFSAAWFCFHQKQHQLLLLDLLY
jgi:hypothetical protein